jgi:hypothetical protein
MEFDRSKILTVVTADQAKVGQKGWFGEYLDTLKERVEKEQPNVLERVDLSGKARYIFRTNGDGYSLFYPEPEPSYRPFTNDELNDIVGKVVTSKLTGNNRIVSERASHNLVRIGGSQYTAENLLEWYILNGEPCGMKE